MASRKNEVLRSAAIEAAEYAAVDDRVVVADLAVGPIHRSRDIRHPEVLVAKARRPGSGELKLTAIDVDRIRDHAKCHGVAAAEQAGARQVEAAGVSGRALAVVEVAAEVITGTRPGRLDVDA